MLHEGEQHGLTGLAIAGIAEGDGGVGVQIQGLAQQPGDQGVTPLGNEGSPPPIMVTVLTPLP